MRRTHPLPVAECRLYTVLAVHWNRAVVAVSSLVIPLLVSCAAFSLIALLTEMDAHTNDLVGSLETIKLVATRRLWCGVLDSSWPITAVFHDGGVGTDAGVRGNARELAVRPVESDHAVF